MVIVSIGYIRVEYNIISRLPFILRPGGRCLPNPRPDKPNPSCQGVRPVLSIGVAIEAVLYFIEDHLRNHFGRGIGTVKTDHTVAIGLPESVVHGVFRVDAHCMIQRIEESFQRDLKDGEIADHVVCIQRIGLQNQFYPAGMPVRIPAVFMVLGEHVSALDFDGFTDTVGHVYLPLVCP